MAMNEVCEYIAAKAVVNVFSEAKDFFLGLEDLEEAKRRGEVTIIYDKNWNPTGFNYKTKTGQRKTVSKQEIIAQARRLKTSAITAINIFAKYHREIPNNSS